MGRRLLPAASLVVPLAVARCPGPRCPEPRGESPPRAPRPRPVPSRSAATAPLLTHRRTSHPSRCAPRGPSRQRAWPSCRGAGPGPAPRGPRRCPRGRRASHVQLAGRESRRRLGGGGWGRRRGEGPIFTRSPRKVVHAPGDGVQPRICRSTARPGRDHRTRASSTSILGASETPPRSEARGSGCRPRCRRGWRRAGHPATPAGRGAPGCVRRPDRLGHDAEDGTGVQPGLEQEGRGPGDLVAGHDRVLHRGSARQAGSSEKCRLTHPWPGISSAGDGTSAP